MNADQKTPKLRVAMLIQQYLPHIGGAERQIASLAPLLQQRGIDVHVITRKNAGLTAYEVIDSVPVHRLPVFKSRALASLSYTLHAIKTLFRLKPDVVHAHELLSPTTTALAYRRLRGTPVIAKVLRGGELGDIEKLRRGRTGAMRVKTVSQSVDRFAVISDEIDAELAEIGVSGAHRIRIPNGVDTNRFATSNVEQRIAKRTQLKLANVPLVVFFGRLSKEKNLAQLIDTWPRVRSQHKDAELLIIGDGPERDQLDKKSSAGTTLMPAIDNVEDYLRAADVFVLPSLTEGMSNALLEAMSSGLACIASRVGAATDLIQTDVNGLLITPGNEDELADALIKTLQSSDYRKTLGDGARRTIESRYSLDSVADKLVEQYRLLSENQR